jgi:5-(carboxyamino)imidazole ribonucleotide synthase
MMEQVILPGSIVGILGSGQLGRMLALAARRSGYHMHVFSPEANSPAGQVADREFVAAYDDLDAVRDFARSVDVVTYEFENVPLATAETCAAIVPLRPGPEALRVAQNRLREKTFFAENGLPTVPFTAVHSLPDLQAGLTQIGCPAVLKTAVSGYDGKGQVRIANNQWSIVNSQRADSNLQSPISNLQSQATAAWQKPSATKLAILEGVD